MEEVSDAVDILAPRSQPGKDATAVFHARLNAVRWVLRELPKQHWLRLNTNLLSEVWRLLAEEANASIVTGPEHRAETDSILYDSFLVDVQTPMTVVELGKMLEAADLAALSFWGPPLHYMTGAKNPDLRAAMGLSDEVRWSRRAAAAANAPRQLSVLEHAVLTESFVGRITKHIVLVGRTDAPRPRTVFGADGGWLRPTSAICTTSGAFTDAPLFKFYPHLLRAESAKFDNTERCHVITYETNGIMVRPCVCVQLVSLP